MEELVRFTVESSINETLEIDLGLSKAFCSNLLKDDPTDLYSATTGNIWKSSILMSYFPFDSRENVKEKKGLMVCLVAN